MDERTPANRRVVVRREAPEFMSHWVMTYLAVYRGDERGGRPFEAWSGALALPTQEG